MKKILFTILALLWVSLGLQAQITLTAADYANFGSKVVQVTDTLPSLSITPGSAGANVTYDFTALHSDAIDTNNFISPGAGVLGASFPMSNVSLNLNNANYLYFDTTSAGIYLWGYSGDLLFNNVSNALVLSKPQTVITLPSAYNTSFVDTAAYDETLPYDASYLGYFVDSLREKETVTIASLMDGWGTVETPNGSFACLRQNIVKHSVDSTWALVSLDSTYEIWIFLFTDTSTTQSYSYLSNHTNIEVPIVDVEYYSDSSAIYQVKWNPATTTGIKNYSEPLATIYPNPASDYLNISRSSNNNICFTIYDLAGRAIMNTGMFSDNNKTISVANIQDGTYIVKMFNNDGVVGSDKIVIIH